MKVVQLYQLLLVALLGGSTTAIADIRLQAPLSTGTEDTVIIPWDGRERSNHFMMVDAAGEMESRFHKHPYTRNGSSLRLNPLDKSGHHDMHYLIGGSV